MNRILKVITLFPRDELETWKVTGGGESQLVSLTCGI
jgi:hypothetical protein